MYSPGGTETLITYSLTQTHADVPEELLQKNGITDCLFRLSVGVEHVDDLISDLENAMRGAVIEINFISVYLFCVLDSACELWHSLREKPSKSVGKILYQFKKKEFPEF